MADEWDVVEAIYPDYVSRRSSEDLITLSIPVNLQIPYRLTLDDDPNSLSISVTVLPPVILAIRLPREYPTSCPPDIVSMNSTHSWFSSEECLRSHLVELWQAEDQVLCLWIEYIESGTFLDDLSMRDAAHSLIRIPGLSRKLALKLQADQSNKLSEEEQASNNTKILCSMLACQSHVLGPKFVDGVEPSKMDYLCTCNSCHYSFCARCLHAWHGPVQGCFDNSLDLVMEQYAALAPDDPKRLFLEQKHGMTSLSDLMSKRDEDMANERWFRKHTKPCPGCRVPIEKAQDSCNLLCCTRCNTSLCYFCGKKLPEYHDTGHSSEWHYHTRDCCDAGEGCPYR